MTEKTCRICLKNSEKKSDQLIRSCKCEADIVHKSCIEKWLELTSQTNCPLCGFEYKAKFCPKNYWNYLKETRVERDDIIELNIRSINIIHLTLLVVIIFLHNISRFKLIQYIFFSIIFVITLGRLFSVFRLCSLFYSRSTYNYKEWQKTHFTVNIVAYTE